jgi:hypothetical protein
MNVVSAPLPDLDLVESSTLTVDTQDPLAIIDSVAIHFRQDTPAELLDAAGLPPLFVYVPTPVA